MFIWNIKKKIRLEKCWTYIYHFWVMNIFSSGYFYNKHFFRAYFVDLWTWHSGLPLANFPILIKITAVQSIHFFK